jgi:hypothetical protein
MGRLRSLTITGVIAVGWELCPYTTLMRRANRT